MAAQAGLLAAAIGLWPLIVLDRVVNGGLEPVLKRDMLTIYRQLRSYLLMT